MNGLNIKQIQEIIPHRHPFLLIDFIEDFKPGEYAVGYKCVTYREEFFRGHFPQEPVMPGVLTIEALAQVGDLVQRRKSWKNRLFRRHPEMQIPWKNCPR